LDEVMSAGIEATYTHFSNSITVGPIIDSYSRSWWSINSRIGFSF